MSNAFLDTFDCMCVLICTCTAPNKFHKTDIHVLSAMLVVCCNFARCCPSTLRVIVWMRKVALRLLNLKHIYISNSLYSSCASLYLWQFTFPNVTKLCKVQWHKSAAPCICLLWYWRWKKCAQSRDSARELIDKHLNGMLQQMYCSFKMKCMIDFEWVWVNDYMHDASVSVFQQWPQPSCLWAW